MKKKIKLTLIMAVMFAATVNGQIAPPPIPPPPPPGLPIDGGLIFLFISGIIYGARRLKNN